MADEQEAKSTEEVVEGATVTSDEIARAAQIPATFVTRMIATNLPHGMRLALGEQIGEQPTQFRFAAFLSFEDADALRLLLERQLSRLQKVEVEITSDGKIVPRNG